MQPPKKIKIQAQLCPKNHHCPSLQYCPNGAISQASIQSAPQIDETKCTACGLCTKMCRVFTLSS